VARLALETLGGFTVEICNSGARRSTELQVSSATHFAGRDDAGMDGPTTLGKLRELPQFAATPVIFVTAKVQPGEVRATGKLAQPMSFQAFDR